MQAQISAKAAYMLIQAWYARKLEIPLDKAWILANKHGGGGETFSLDTGLSVYKGAERWYLMTE